jgi:small conductance mechanosensitive channel
VVPNNSITGGNIVNYDANATRRIDLKIGCSYNDDLKAVKALLVKLIEQDSRILKSPAAQVAVSELADFSVNFEVRPWVKRDDYGAVRSDLIERIKVGFDEKGFTIPCPVPDIVVHAAAPNAKAA